MTHLELGHGNQARSAEVYTVTDGAQVHRFVIRSPQEALELFRLLDAELGICASCDKPIVARGRRLVRRRRRPAVLLGMRTPQVQPAGVRPRAGGVMPRYIDEHVLLAAVDRSHTEDGCHKHDTPQVVAEGSCCICDACEPCQGAIDRAVDLLEDEREDAREQAALARAEQ